MSNPSPVISTATDWPVHTIGEMTTLLRRGTAPVYVGESEIMAIGQRCITDASFDGSRSRPHSARAMSKVLNPEVNDVLINSTGTGTIGRSVIFRDGTGNYIVDGHVTVARPRQTELVSRWLNDVLRSPAGQRYLESKCYAGSTNQVELSSSALAAMPIAVPGVLEQRKVADVLDAVDQQISAVTGIVSKLSALRLGLLQDLMTRGIDTSGELRPDSADDRSVFMDGVCGPRPKDWQVGLLDQFGKRGSGHTPNKNVPSYWNGGIKWVSLADSSKLDRFMISDTDKEISEAGIANSSAVLHPAGTVILSRDAGVGKSAIISESMAVSQHFMAWRCGPELDSVYLYYWLQFMKRAFEAIALGSTIQTIGLSYFRKLHIAVPPLDEQKSIAIRMRQAECAIDRARDELSALMLLRAGLSVDLLTGRVRIPEEAVS